MGGLLFVGAANMDLIMKIERTPAPGETLMGQEALFLPGGKGANGAVAAAKLGAKVQFAGMVGGDENGRGLLDSLSQNGVDVSLVGRVPGTTGLAVISVQSDGQNRILYFPGANDAMDGVATTQALAGLDARGIGAVVLQLELPVDSMLAVMEWARQNTVAIVLDAGPVRELRGILPAGIDVLTPNQTECDALCGIHPDDPQSAAEAAKKLMGIYQPKSVLIKLGAIGALWTDGEQTIFAPSFRVKAVDPTAAGDAFTAAFAKARAEDKGVADALRYACAVGALTATGVGAQASLPTPDAVAGMLARDEAWPIVM